ncbi:MAG: rhomboid family intramembrane serine protease [Methanomassiliicoccaceae archaeon]|nr:rhomboid family intramembrane serine protease [Methanomassiliicoccaceae archaeon]
METVSWIIIAIVAVTLILLALRKHSPTIILAASNMIIFTVMMTLGSFERMSVTIDLGFKSTLFFNGEDLWTIVTSMFVHANFMHLIGNMLFLVAIGLPLESRIGKERFIAIYFLGGMAGSALFAFTEWNSSIIYVAVGASGAISALMGAMIMLYPREKIMFFLGPILTNRFSVWIPIVIWFAMQLFLFPLDPSPVAYAAHLGGFAAGAGIARILRPGKTSKDICTDISALERLCTSASLREMYGHAENSIDDNSKMIWAENILKNVKCPECGSKITMTRKGFRCENDHEI